MPEHLTAGPTLADLERRVERCLGSVVEAGEALAEIHNGRLYAHQHRTFEAYVLARWPFTPRRAYQLMSAAEVEANLRTIGSYSPKSERQLRVLARLDPADQRAVWRMALADAGEEMPAAKAVADLVAARLAALPDQEQLALVQAHEAALAEQTRPAARPVNWPRRLSNAERTLVRLQAECPDEVHLVGVERVAAALGVLEELARAVAKS